MLKFFICYRREPTAGYAAWLYSALVSAFGKENVFWDADIAPGHDFAARIQDALQVVDVVLVLIDTFWLGATDSTGRHRLDDPDDFVRLEIALALQNGTTVIPVLVGEATLPQASDLPEDIKGLVHCQATQLTHREHDLARLIVYLQTMRGKTPLSRQFLTLLESNPSKTALLQFLASHSPKYVDGATRLFFGDYPLRDTVFDAYEGRVGYEMRLTLVHFTDFWSDPFHNPASAEIHPDLQSVIFDIQRSLDAIRSDPHTKTRLANDIIRISHHLYSKVSSHLYPRVDFWIFGGRRFEADRSAERHDSWCRFVNEHHEDVIHIRTYDHVIESLRSDARTAFGRDSSLLAT